MYTDIWGLTAITDLHVNDLGPQVQQAALLDSWIDAWQP